MEKLVVSCIIIFGYIYERNVKGDILGIYKKDYLARVDGAGFWTRTSLALLSKLYAMESTVVTGITRGVTKFIGNWIGGWFK